MKTATENTRRQANGGTRRGEHGAVQHRLEGMCVVQDVRSGVKTLGLGNAITFQTYRVPVESRDAFRLDDMFRVLDSAIHVSETDDERDFGWVRIDGDLCRVYATRDERQIRFVPPDRRATHVSPDDVTSTDSWLADQVAAGTVERISPIPLTSMYERRSDANLPPRRE